MWDTGDPVQARKNLHQEPIMWQPDPRLSSLQLSEKSVPVVSAGWWCFIQQHKQSKTKGTEIKSTKHCAKSYRWGDDASGF